MAVSTKLRMRGRLYLIASLVLMFLAVTLSCSDDNCETCPTCPEVKSSNDIYDGLLYVGLSGVPYTGNTDIYIVDTETEQVVDSITYSERDALSLDVTADGKLLAVSDADATTRVYDTGTKEILKSFTMQSLYGFIGDDRYLLLHRVGTWIYSVPDFALVHEDTIDVDVNPYYLYERNSLFSIANQQFLYEYSLDSFVVTRSWRLYDVDGDSLHLWSFDISENGHLLHSIAANERGSCYITWDLDSDTLISQHPIAFWTGSVQVNPVCDQVYVTEPGFGPTDGTGTIYVFDRRTGEYLDGISLFGYRDDPRIPLSARNMVLAPDGSQLYIVSDATQWRAGTVLRVDTKSRRIESLLFPALDIYPLALALAPRP